MMPGFDEDGITFKYIQRLTELRKEYACLQTGTQREMWAEDNIYAFSRRDDSNGQEIISVFNNGTSNETRAIPPACRKFSCRRNHADEPAGHFCNSNCRSWRYHWKGFEPDYSGKDGMGIHL